MTVKGGYLIIISGPSWVVKSTFTLEFLSSIKNMDFSVSYTTRDKLTMENDQEHYKFISKDQLSKDKYRAISDFISGMTDRYAINLYNNIK